MKKGRMFLCSILCLFVSVGISNATEFIVNGGFENGLTGWSYSANVVFRRKMQLGQISAYEGNYMAVLATGSGLRCQFVGKISIQAQCSNLN